MTALVLEAGDSAAEFSGVLALAYVVPLFYRAEPFLERHCWWLRCVYPS